MLLRLFPEQLNIPAFTVVGGFTIIIENANLTAQYSHLSPNFYCKKGDFVNAGEIIGTVRA